MTKCKKYLQHISKTTNFLKIQSFYKKYSTSQQKNEQQKKQVNKKYKQMLQIKFTNTVLISIEKMKKNTPTSWQF